MNAQSFVLPSYFRSGMVLQQHAPLRLEGVGPAGALLELEITCRPGGQADFDRRFGVIHRDRCMTGSDGRFVLTIPPLSASYHLYTISIRTADAPPADPESLPYVRRPGAPAPTPAAIQLDDVLVGEVWISGGQGNMEMPLYAADSGKYKDLLDQNPHVRFFSQNPFGLDADSSTYSYRPQIECAACRWLTAQDYADLRRVSALAAHFAVNLEKALKVPIGIVETALSEAPIQSWIDRRTILLAPAFVEALKGRGLWVEEADWQAESRCSLRQPAALFNHKIAPLSGMHVRGFLLSQGENEVGDEDFYAQAFALQLKSWQTVFRPVPGEQIQLVYTGLAPACYAEHSPAALPGFNLMLAGFRKRCELPTGFVAVQDLDPEWESNPEAWRQPRHPAVKREWAERAATIALGLTYRRKLPPTSPEVSRVKRVDNKLMLSFRHLQQPLTLRQGDRVLKGFAVCGADQVFRNAEARLLYGLEVMVWHPDIEWPRQVTYAYSGNVYRSQFAYRREPGRCPFFHPQEAGYAGRADDLDEL